MLGRPVCVTPHYGLVHATMPVYERESSRLVIGNLSDPHSETGMTIRSCKDVALFAKKDAFVSKL